ncbi:MAG TPA: DUF58 domain-containing protein, partial [Trueperaceae bacterium]
MELPAELLKRLEFKVLRRLDGFLFGETPGLFYGPSLDLAEVREYQPGDEVRRIDWNVTARTGVVHVRQYREQREVILWLIVDLSPSMAFGTRRNLKRRQAVDFAGLAAAVVARAGDKVGGLAFSRAGMRVTPLGAGRKHVLRLLHDLLSSQTEDAPPPGPDLATALAHTDRTLRRRALVMVVSDFAMPTGRADGITDPPWSSGLHRLALRHDLIAVRVTDPAEHELPDAGDLRLRDPESGQEAWIDTSDPRVRQAHARLVRERE